jgi:hypothetical protein
VTWKDARVEGDSFVIVPRSAAGQSPWSPPSAPLGPYARPSWDSAGFAMPPAAQRARPRTHRPRWLRVLVRSARPLGIAAMTVAILAVLIDCYIDPKESGILGPALVGALFTLGAAMALPSR